MLNRFFLIGLIIFIAGCGYRPATHYVKNSLGNNIYPIVSIPIRSPEYAIAITDSVRESIVGRFKANIASSKESATSILSISGAKYSVSPIQTGELGLTILYRAKVTLTAAISGKNIKNQSFTVSGIYDFPAKKDENGNTISSEENKLNAIKEASLKALDEFMSKLAIRMMQK